MNDFLKLYGDSEGPCGFPMKDADAKALDALMQRHPDAVFHRAVVEKATTELRDGERADVSWIQTETIDRQGEIVLAAGFRDDHFRANPIVTINHDYSRHPVGRSTWRRKMRDGHRAGVKAKTVYPPRPAEWQAETWPSDAAWSLVKSGLMAGKSIGFLTLKAHAPTEDEVRRRPELANVRRIVEEWLLLEYSCCWIPVNPEAVVEATSKALIDVTSMRSLGLELPEREVIAFTPLEECRRAIDRALKAIDPAAMVSMLVDDAIARISGRI